MSPELAQISDRLRGLAGRRPRVLPPPYRLGHFSLYGAAPFPLDADFQCVFRGDTAFVTLKDAALARLLFAMDARTPSLDVNPARSPLDTLLYQILHHGFKREGAADCPYLARLCLDLDEDAKRRARTLKLLEEALGAHYARSLRLGVTASTLPAVARQIVYHRETLAELTNGGNGQ